MRSSSVGARPSAIASDPREEVKQMRIRKTDKALAPKLSVLKGN
jgi:hypothetical protein